PVLARLGRPEHRIAVLDGGRARPDPARLPPEPELWRVHFRREAGRDGRCRGAGPLRPVRLTGSVLGAMIKQTPSLGRMIAMIAFTLSVFAILIFLWLAFGGTVPLKPEGFRFTVHMPEAATLAEEAHVRMGGGKIGKVKSKEL